MIVFSGSDGQLYQVPARGGAPTALTFRRDNRESLWPSFLPDGRHFVYFGRREKAGLYVASLDLGEGTKLLVKALVCRREVLPRPPRVRQGRGHGRDAVRSTLRSPSP